MLENIPGQRELQSMSRQELDALAADIRAFIIEKVAEKGGHLSSNLGTVELTLALFSVFDFPKDKCIWDVGHQSYTYKLLSGRKEGFDSLREFGGMSGFPKRSESAYDAFDTGHSSTSISAGLGMVAVRDNRGEDHHVISVIGDGSLTGGMAFEALNNASRIKSNYIIILNDNEMSIARNVGGLRKYLTGIRAGRGYNRVKNDVKKSLTGIPRIGAGLTRIISDIKDSIKEILVPSGMLFENIGITYLGPVDGHNITEMRRILKEARELNRCVLIHVRTQKGKGYKPAEEQPDVFHGIDPFDVATGKVKKKKNGPTWSEVFGAFMAEEGQKNDKLAGITAAMSHNVGLTAFEKSCPERFYDVGIAEQHAVTFAAGMAAAGMHPVTAIFSSFLQRSYDQIAHDVCMQDLPVTFAIDRAGLVGKDGETHQGVFDIGYMTELPNMTVMAPKNAEELTEMLKFAVNEPHPVSVRYPRGEAYTGLSGFRSSIVKGRAEVLHRASGIALLAFGCMNETAEEVRLELKKQGILATSVNLRFAKPLDTELLLDLAKDHSLFVTMEDGALLGGIGEQIGALMAEKASAVQVMTIGVPDRFIPQGTVDELRKMLNMDAVSITERILETLK